MNRRITVALPAVAAFALLTFAPAAQALVINPIFDSTVTSSAYATQIEAGFNTAAAAIASNIGTSATINIDVSWGYIAGQSLGASGLGASSDYYYQTLSSGQAITGSTIQSWLTAAAASPGATKAEINSVKNLAAAVRADAAYRFFLPTAEAKALGLVNPTAGLDGYIGFGSALKYTFSGPVKSGTYDFVAVAQHEIEEVMGRASGIFSASPSFLTPYDLFRYTAPGVTTHSYTALSYFSIDGGTTNLGYFNNSSSGGDRGDFNGATADVDNAFLAAGQTDNLLQTDFTILDTLGYNASPGALALPTASSIRTVIAHQDVPEPSALLLFAAGLAGLGLLSRRRPRVKITA